MGIRELPWRIWERIKGSPDSNQPTWAGILSTLYQAKPPERVGHGKDIQENYSVEDLREASSLPPEEFQSSLGKLESWGLIELDTHTLEVVADDSGETEDMTIKSVKLTDDGFSVAHDRQLGQKQNKLNHSLVLVTALLVLINFIAVAPLSTDETAVVVVVFGILFVILIARTDILER